MTIVHSSSSPPDYPPTPFGKPMLKHFLFNPKYKNLNHGSFGAFPRAIQAKQRQIHDLVETSPDLYIRYTYPQLLDQSRLALSEIVHAPIETIVLVQNATVAMNTILRNIVWNDDGKDEILYLSTIYGACGNTVEYMVEYSTSKVTGRKIPVTYPIEDDEMVGLLRNGIMKSREEGKRPRIAIFDTITSMPGVRVPFEALTALCHDEGVLSLIDGAHGIGHINLNLTSLNPDFFLTNCHKWLFVPRGCCLLYVPLKHQSLIRSTLPTSHSYKPSAGIAGVEEVNPYITKKTGSVSKGDFAEMFEYIGTIDDSAYTCVTEALKWRHQVCGGEEAIITYTTNLAKTGGARIAEILNTYVLDNSTHTITNCSMVNIRMPLTTDPEELTVNPTWFLVREEEKKDVAVWMTETLALRYGSYLPVFGFQGCWWTRISAQVYLDLDDFEWAGGMLRELSERVGKGGFVDA